MKQTLQLNKKKKTTWSDKLLPKYYAKKRCKHCGDYIRFFHKKKFICKKCRYYVYYDEKEEFKDRMKGLIR